jgi:hypothetical protein
MIDKIGYRKTSKAVGGMKNLIKILKGPDAFNVRITAQPDDIRDYLQGDRKYRGKTTLYEIMIVEPWDLWDNYAYYDPKSLLEDLVDENISRIRKILSKENNKDLSQVSLEELLDYDDNKHISDALMSSANNVDADAYGNYLYDCLKSALEEYGGEVEKMNDEEIVFTVPLGNYLSNIEEEYLNDYLWRCGEDIECLFHEMLSDGDIDKPKPHFDDYWYNSDFDTRYFNELVADRLYDYD